METLSVSYLIPSIQATSLTRRRPPYAALENFPRVSLFSSKVEKRIDYSHIIPCSKKSVYQDFQNFAKPLHLLPATQVATYPMDYTKEIISSLELDHSTSIYMIELRTSRDFASCLSDINSAIMICLIDVNGRSILQRISAISQDRDDKISEHVHFQRGSVDTTAFKGPKLEQIAALWIGLESGSWRLDGVGVKVINGPTPSSSSSIQYKFEANNILLGDGGGLSVVELRPILVTEASSINSSPEASDFDPKLMKEGGMREYAALKFSLLLYDFILVIAGAAVLTVSSNEANAYSFLLGGICGFLYLLLLQRSVDGLSAPPLSVEDDNGEMSWQNYSVYGPVAILVSVLFAGIVLCGYCFGGRSVLFSSSSEIFTGVAGFLTCKVAVVIAAFKPVPMSIEKNRFE